MNRLRLSLAALEPSLRTGVVLAPAALVTGIVAKLSSGTVHFVAIVVFIPMAGYLVAVGWRQRSRR